MAPEPGLRGVEASRESRREKVTMPIYEYQCLSCGKRTEELQRMSDPPLAACPSCGGEVKKLVSSPAFHLKGSGWYATDYGGKKGGGGESGGAESSKGEGGGGGSKAEKSEGSEKSEKSEKKEGSASEGSSGKKDSSSSSSESTSPPSKPASKAD